MHSPIIQKYLYLLDRNEDIYQLMQLEEQKRLSLCSGTTHLLEQLTQFDLDLKEMKAHGLKNTVTAEQEENRLLDIAQQLRVHVLRVDKWQHEVLSTREAILSFIKVLNGHKDRFQQNKLSEEEFNHILDVLQ